MRGAFGRLAVAVFLTAVVLVFAGCATRQYVKHQVGTIEPQISEVRSAQAEQAERIDAVDRRAQEGVNSANRAFSVAELANERALAADRRAGDADRRADSAQQNAQRALNRIDAVETTMESRFTNLDRYSVVDQKAVTFKFDSDLLSTETLSKLDDISDWVSTAKTGYLIELRGFTDNIGSEKYNFGLSERRAEAVQRYLVSKDVPLHRIIIVGLGENNPVSDNKTAGGREQNRRVEIRVLRSGAPTSAASR
jgi:outer membrane protein OmpA-like peptidoglycan-associated protein